MFLCPYLDKNVFEFIFGIHIEQDVVLKWNKIKWEMKNYI